MAEPDPYVVPCPTCPAGRHEHCFVERTGKELATPHVKRAKRAGEVIAEQRRRAEGDATARIEAARWRRLYVACRLELEQRGDWTTLAAEQLESMVHNMSDAAQAREDRTGKLTTEGSMGQKVPHPNIATELRLEAQALATARSLKLTPDTRGTSAPRPGDEDVPQDAGEAQPDGERDELAVLDDLAEKRKELAATGGRKRAKRRRG